MRISCRYFFVLSVCVALCGVNIRTAYALEESCIYNAVASLSTLQKSNVASRLKSNFSILSLAKAAYGGGAKWKANPDDHEAILARFSDTALLERLYKELEKFKVVTKVKFVEVTPVKIITQMTAGGERKTVTFFGKKGSCRFSNLCIKGAGCVHELF